MSSQSQTLIGRSIPRVEDARLLRGAGRYLDDIALPGPAACGLPCAARSRMRASAASTPRRRAAPTACTRSSPTPTCARAHLRPHPLALPAGALKFDADPPVLAEHEVCYVGEPVALVVAGKPPRRRGCGAHGRARSRPVARGDRSGRRARARGAEGAARQSGQSRRQARHRLRRRRPPPLRAPRCASPSACACTRCGGHSIETRGVMARFDSAGPALTVWASTRARIAPRRSSYTALGLAEHEVRVIAPDVGGGFGPKGVFHPEDPRDPGGRDAPRRADQMERGPAGKLLRRAQERDQIWDMEAAVRRGRQAAGDPAARSITITARTRPTAWRCPFNAATNLIRALCAARLSARYPHGLTNFVPATPTRGAGRPQGHLRDGAAARPRRSRARSFSRRGARAQPDPAGKDAVRHPGEASATARR